MQLSRFGNRSSIPIQSQHNVPDEVQSTVISAEHMERTIIVANPNVGIRLERQPTDRIEATGPARVPQEYLHRQLITNNNLRPDNEQYEANLSERNIRRTNCKCRNTDQPGNAYSMNKSVCVVLTSNPGKSLTELSLKLDHFNYSMRRQVRFWRGRPPWPEEHAAVKPQMQLNW